MRFSTKIGIIDLFLFLSLIAILFVSVETSETAFDLPTEGTKIFSIELKEKWFYVFEVVTWSGDEVINVSIQQEDELIFIAVLEGEELEYGLDLELPPLGGGFLVEKSGNYTLVTNVIVQSTDGDSTYLILNGSNQHALGFNAGPLIISLVIALVCGFIALIGAFFFELFRTLFLSRKEINKISKSERGLNQSHENREH